MNNKIDITISSLFKGEGFKKVNDAVKGMGRSMKGATQGLAAISGELGQISGPLGKVGDGISKFIGSFASGGVVIAALTTAVSGLTWAWNKYKEATDGVIEQAKKLYGNLEQVREATHRLWQNRFAKRAEEQRKEIERQKQAEEQRVRMIHAAIEANAELAKSQYELVDGQERLKRLGRESEWQQRIDSAANENVKKLIQAQVDLERAQQDGADKIRRAEQDYQVALERSTDPQGTLSDQEFNAKRKAALNRLEAVKQNRDVVAAEVSNAIQRAESNLSKVQNEVAKAITKAREDAENARQAQEQKAQREKIENRLGEIKKELQKISADEDVLAQRVREDEDRRRNDPNSQVTGEGRKEARNAIKDANAERVKQENRENARQNRMRNLERIAARRDGAHWLTDKQKKELRAWWAENNNRQALAGKRKTKKELQEEQARLEKNAQELPNNVMDIKDNVQSMATTLQTFVNQNKVK